MCEAISIPAADGYPLRGYQWQHPKSDGALPPVAIINPATSVSCRYYSRFADYLHAHGWDVVTYDYRGIGESRQGFLRHLRADCGRSLWHGCNRLRSRRDIPDD